MIGFIKTISYIVVATIAVLLVLDFLIVKNFFPNLIAPFVNYGIEHKIYHHELLKSRKIETSYGYRRFSFCTDKNSFKTDCKNILGERKIFDIAFIGDSYTQGAGFDYNDTFVGLIDKKLKSFDVANLGVSSYSPSIYYAKIKYLLSKKYYFKEVIVFIDISDIQDEVDYSLNSDDVVSKSSARKMRFAESLVTKVSENKFFFKENFPATYFGLKILKLYYTHTFTPPSKINDVVNFPRAEWTYNIKSGAYGLMGAEKAIEKSILIMNKLYELLKKNNIDLSIAVYPHPAQLKHDSVNNLQVEIWSKFCENRCKKFYNFMYIFYDYMDVHGLEDALRRYYILGDDHFNKKGNEVIAQEFLKKYQ